MWVGKTENKLIKHNGSSKSLTASIKVGYLSFTKCLTEYYGLFTYNLSAFLVSPRILALLIFFKYILTSLNFYNNFSCAKKLISLTW